MITSFVLPISLLPITIAISSRSSPTVTTLVFPRIPIRQHRLASVTESINGGEEEEDAAGSTNGSLPGLPPVEEEDDEFCPVDCVTEFKTGEDFRRHLERAKATGALVVVDFYRPSCSS
jgi:hypothetical protein